MSLARACESTPCPSRPALWAVAAALCLGGALATGHTTSVSSGERQAASAKAEAEALVGHLSQLAGAGVPTHALDALDLELGRQRVSVEGIRTAGGVDVAVRNLRQDTCSALGEAAGAEGSSVGGISVNGSRLFAPGDYDAARCQPDRETVYGTRPMNRVVLFVAT